MLIDNKRKYLNTIKKIYVCQIILLILILVLMSYISTFAQGFTMNNKTDRFHPWVSDINPALVSFQNSRISAGLRIYHLDFLHEKSLGITESRISISSPYFLPFGIGVGCNLRYFSAGIYSELAGSLQVSKRFIDRFSIGIKIGVVRYGFAHKDFVLVDESHNFRNI